MLHANVQFAFAGSLRVRLHAGFVITAAVLAASVPSLRARWVGDDAKSGENSSGDDDGAHGFFPVFQLANSPFGLFWRIISRQYA
jgi:hypothetical protein